MVPPLRELTAAAQEDGIRINVAQADNDAAALVAGERVRDVEDAVAAPAETTLPGRSECPP